MTKKFGFFCKIKIRQHSKINSRAHVYKPLASIPLTWTPVCWREVMQQSMFDICEDIERINNAICRDELVISEGDLLGREDRDN